MIDIRRSMVSLIEATENPVAPLIIQNAYGGLPALGKMMAGCTTPADVEAMADKLTQAWPGKKIDKVCGTPAFIMALCSMLATSIEQYVKDTSK